MDLYRILGAPPDATQDELRRAYRARARQLHPDLSGDPADADAMRDLNDAWGVLSDPVLRAEYDALLADDMGFEAGDDAEVDLERRLQHAPGCARRAPVVAILIVLLAIFVMTAYVAVPAGR